MYMGKRNLILTFKDRDFEDGGTCKIILSDFPETDSQGIIFYRWWKSSVFDKSSYAMSNIILAVLKYIVCY